MKSPPGDGATTTSDREVASAEPPLVDVTKLPRRERWRRALAALARVMANPEATDEVLTFSMYANAGTLPGRIDRFFDDPRGRRLYDEQRAIDTRTVDLDALAALPADTLGWAYAEFLRSRGLTPDVFRDAPKEMTDPRMAFVVKRLRQSHDLWHVVTGFDTDPASEVALQAFSFGQLQAPSTAILAVLGTLRARSMKPGLVFDVVAAFRAGRRAEKLAVFPWEDHWTTPLAEIRTMLGLPPRVARSRR